MAKPLVRRAVELSNGSIVDVVRRVADVTAQAAGEVTDDADDAVASAVDDSGGVDDSGAGVVEEKQ